MNVKKYDVEQGGEEWKKLRLGKFTSSEIYNLMTEPRAKKDKEAGEMSQTAKTYIKEKTTELIYGEVPEIYGAALDWGNEFEDEARQMFAQIHELEIQNGGFYDCPELWTGASPDGEGIDADGQKFLIEIKCPYNRKNHIENVLNLEFGKDLLKHNKQYYYQVQHQLFITGAKYCFFVSYDPRLIENENFYKSCIHSVEINADDELFKVFENKLKKAAAYQHDILETLVNR